MFVVISDVDKVFKALADPTRRTLLDSLRHDNGQRWGGSAGSSTWRASRPLSTWPCWRKRT